MNAREKGKSLYHGHSYSRALKLFLEEETDPGEDSELAYYMGLCYVRLQITEEAVGLFEQVLRNDVNLARQYQVRMLLAWILVEHNEIEQALQYLNDIIDLGMNSPQVWSALGYCQWRLELKDSAFESYKKAVKLDIDNSNAVNGLGYILADSGKDLDLALKLCRKAVEMNPDNLSYKDSLGWALFRVGKNSEAVRYLTEAISERPDDEIIRNHLEAVRINDKKKVHN